jgi:hypothetical protein
MTRPKNVVWGNQRSHCSTRVLRGIFGFKTCSNKRVDKITGWRAYQFIVFIHCCQCY